MSGFTISDAFDLYCVEYIEFRNQSVRTREMCLTACKSLVELTGDIEIEDLSFEHVRRWKAHMSKTKSQNTVRGYIIKLRTVLAFLRLKGYDVLNPDLVGVPKRSATVVEFITPEEVNKLIQCIFKAKNGYSTLNRYRNRAIISLLYASGIRVSELCSLNRLSIQNDGTFTIVGKGGKARLCFTDARTMQYIKEYLNLRNDNDPALFISENTGKRISKDTVEIIFRTAKARTGFEKKIHPHVMRHSFATNLLKNNTNLVYVRDFLGHSSVQTTEMYTHVVNEDLKRIYTQKHTV